MSTDKNLALDLKTAHLSQAIEKQLAANMSLKSNGKGGQDGHTKLTADDYKALLPETTVLASGKELSRDETYDALLQNQEHNTYFIAASYDALGSASLATSKKHDDLLTVNGDISLGGKNKLKNHWTRESEVNAEIPKKGEVAAKRTAYGTMGGKVQVHGSKAGAGELSKVMDRQEAMAQALFGGK